MYVCMRAYIHYMHKVCLFPKQECQILNTARPSTSSAATEAGTVMHGTYTLMNNSEIDHTQKSFTNTQRYDFFCANEYVLIITRGRERHESHLPNSTATSREQVNTHTTATNHYHHHVRNHIILDALSHPTRPFHKGLTQMGVGRQSLIERW